LFYPLKYSMKKIPITKKEVSELIPMQFWVTNYDPVKLFLNNNNIHNYRLQQHWNKKVQYKKPIV
jgi:hypothetical protein